MSHPAASKRPAQTGAVPDDSRAECPFTVRLVDPASGGGGGANGSRNPKKRRKRDRDQSNGDGDGTPGTPGTPGAAGAAASDGAAAGGTATPASRRVLYQAAPFAPRGGFATHSTLDVHYAVEPARAWSEMTRYNSFVLNGVKYFCEGFVYVANEESLQRQKAAAAAASARARGTAAAADATADPAASRRLDDDWVARILEIRASDEHHVYARVFWMYWPDELPAHTVHDGSGSGSGSGGGGKKKKTVPGGRQPHHGASELLASNHMDIINVVSVTSMATVNHLIEDRDDDVQSALYWRQALDVRTMEVSAIETTCACGMPANPDKMLIGCGNEACGKWIHEECLKHYALMRVFERLGRYKPHVVAPASASKRPRKLALRSSGGSADDEENGDVDVKRPLSPSESGGAASVQHSINVKPEGQKDEDAEKTPGSARRARRSGGGASAGTVSNGSSSSSKKKTASATRGQKRKPRASDTSAYEDDEAGEEDDDEADDNDEDYDDAEDDEDDYGSARSRKATRHTPLRRRRETFSPFSSALADGGGLATPTPGSGSRQATARQQRQQQQQQHQQRRPPHPPPSKQPYHNPYPPLHAFGPGPGPAGKRKPPLPYDKLFEATVLLAPAAPAAAENGSVASADEEDAPAAAAAAAPTMIEIRDLRPGVTGGERVWLEPAQCPVCGSAIR